MRMNTKTIALAATVVLTMVLIIGCAANNTSSGNAAATAEQAAPGGGLFDEDAVYGEVTAISDNSVTINVGTMAQRSGGTRPDSGSDSSADDSSADDNSTNDSTVEKDAGSLLELTDEVKEITMTAETEIVKMSMGGGAPQNGQKPDGEPPSGDSDGEPPSEDSDGQKPPDNTETISLTDIQQGDTVMITYNDDNSVAKITVIG